MNQENKSNSGRLMLFYGLLLSPSLLFLAYRMTQSFNGVNAPGFGNMEVFLIPVYAVPALASVILIGLGIDRMRSSK